MVIHEIGLYGSYKNGLIQWKLKVGYELRSYVEGFSRDLKEYLVLALRIKLFRITYFVV